MTIAMPEHLRFISNYSEANLSFDELIKIGKVLAPGFLYKTIKEARKFLTTEPGPNLEIRQALAPGWFDYWLYWLESKSNSDRLIDSQKILSIKSIGKIFKQANKNEEITDAFFMATGEGAPGHRFAWSIAMERANLVAALFEGSKYFQQNEQRRKPYLPEAMTASMAVHFGLYVSVIPNRSDNLPEADHYKEVFKKTKALINFVSDDDPNLKEKILRSHVNYRLLAQIPNLLTPHTSNRTLTLLPDE